MREGLFACLQNSHMGNVQYVDVDMANAALEFWQTGPSTYNHFKQMSAIRLISVHMAWPCKTFAMKDIPRQLGLRNKLRGEGTPLPVLHRDRDALQTRQSIGRPRDHRRRGGQYQSYWQRHGSRKGQSFVLTGQPAKQHLKEA